MKSSALPAWMYGDPANIADGLIARSERANKPKPKPERESKDRYYTQSRSIHIKSIVEFRKKHGGSWAK